MSEEDWDGGPRRIGPNDVITASGGWCAPMAPMYDFGAIDRRWTDASWNVDLFPRWNRLARRYGVITREARARTVAAWRALRHGVDEEDEY